MSLALHHRDGDLDLRQGRADMRRHVVGTFGGVAEQRIAVWNQAAEEAVEVGEHLRVGVLLHQEAGGGVATEEGEESGAGTAGGDGGHPVGHRLGQGKQSPSGRLEHQGVSERAH